MRKNSLPDKSIEMVKTAQIKVFFILLLSITGITGDAQVNETFVPCQEMPELIQNHQADNRSLRRFYFVQNSPERRKRFESLYLSYLDKLNNINYNTLSQECKVDYILFKRDINEALRLSAKESAELEQVKAWFPFAATIYELERSRRRGTIQDAQKIAADLHSIKNNISELQVKLKGEKSLSVTSIRRAKETIDGLKAALKSVFDFYNGYEPLFTWWVPKPYYQLDSALTGYIHAFNEKLNQGNLQKDKSGIVGQPIGRDEIVRQLSYELIPYTPGELIEIANEEFALCDHEMLKASREMGFGDNWKAAMEKVKNTYVPAGEQPKLILRLYNESVDFLKNKELITIPPIAEETWGMIMMTPERQLVNPFFTGGDEISISYPTNTMEEVDRLMSMRGNNPHFSRATVHHELIAGHSLAMFMNRRFRTYRHFDTPFWGEGWPLYWEVLMYDLGFPQSPEDRIGMLFWRMHRCARIIFSLNYHMGKWTPQQCIDFLVDRVGHERANAEGEVRRSFVGGYSPLYQVAYMIGGLQFYTLKKELVDSGKMTYKQFHDAVMQLNSLPVEMVRAILTNQPLDKDFQSKWRFYKKNL
jgi:uncharacterized protein (DUF885 family)